MTSLLELDFVSHISLVDDPAVADSKYVIAKRAGSESERESDSDSEEVGKEGRSLSAANRSELESILSLAESGSVSRTADRLDSFLADVSPSDESPTDGESDSDSDSFTITNMDENDKEEMKTVFVEAFKEAQAETSDSEGSETESPEEPEGPTREELMERIEALEDSEDPDSDSEEEDDSEDPDGEDGDDSLEKRVETLEKSLQQGADRKGEATLLAKDSSEEEEGPLFENGRLDTQAAIAKHSGGSN